MLRKVYVKGRKARNGKWLEAANDDALRALIEEHGDSVLEINMRGTTRGPLPLKFQAQGFMIVCHSGKDRNLKLGWGIRMRATFFCRGTNLDEVLNVRDLLLSDSETDV